MRSSGSIRIAPLRQPSERVAADAEVEHVLGPGPVEAGAVGLDHVALDQRPLAAAVAGERRADDAGRRAVPEHLGPDRAEDLLAAAGIERREGAEVDLREPADVVVAVGVALEHDRVADVEEAVLDHAQVGHVPEHAEPDARRQGGALAAQLADAVAGEADGLDDPEARADRRGEEAVAVDRRVLDHLADHARAPGHRVVVDRDVEHAGGADADEAGVEPLAGEPLEAVEHLPHGRRRALAPDHVPRAPPRRRRCTARKRFSASSTSSMSERSTPRSTAASVQPSTRLERSRWPRMHEEPTSTLSLDPPARAARVADLDRRSRRRVDAADDEHVVERQPLGRRRTRTRPPGSAGRS